MKTTKFNSRNQVIDAFRGLAIILMIFFHFCFDLNIMGLINIDILHGPFWYALPRLIVFLFLFAVGLSLTLAHQDKIHWPVFSKRLLKISFFAVLISGITFIMFPENWIYFGTLHAIALISVISLPFLKKPTLSLVFALLLFIPSLFFDQNLPWISLPHQSWDYISPFPWTGASLLGIFAAHKKFHLLNLPINILNNRLFRSLNFLGKNSLPIYLIHQPLLYGTVYLYCQFLK